MTPARSIISAAFVAMAALSFNAAAQASIVNGGDLVVTTPNTFPSEDKIFIDTSSGQAGVGHVGSQTGDPGTPQINFLANIAVDYKSGTASVDMQIGQGGDKFPYSTLLFSVANGWTFNDLIFATFATDFTITSSNGSVATITDAGHRSGKILRHQRVANYVPTFYGHFWRRIYPVQAIRNLRINSGRRRA
jgi:hypothetical protein